MTQSPQIGLLCSSDVAPNLYCVLSTKQNLNHVHVQLPWELVGCVGDLRQDWVTEDKLAYSDFGPNVSEQYRSVSI